MAKKQLRTPNTQIRNAIRQLFLRSRERARCLKGAVCSGCGNEENNQAHHINGINWERIFAVIREEILTDNLAPLCKECHDKKKEMK